MHALGRFQLLAPIAEGASGAVYRAKDPTLGREVAIKVLHPHAARSPTQRRRFAREARALARLRHPALVAIHEVGEDAASGRPFLVLDLVSGESLQARLSRVGRLAPPEAVAIVSQIAGALGVAHAQGILHRDVKPENVLLETNGQALLTDFGLAKDVGGEASAALTTPGRFLGTAGYWPPEQASGDLDRLGPGSDIYALGATLFAALTGRPPFLGDSIPQLILAAQEAPPTPPSRHAPGCDAELDAIVLRCLEKDPARRFGSAPELAGQLAGYLQRRHPAELWRLVGGAPPAVATAARGGAPPPPPPTSAPSSVEDDQATLIRPSAVPGTAPSAPVPGPAMLASAMPGSASPPRSAVPAPASSGPVGRLPAEVERLFDAARYERASDAAADGDGLSRLTDLRIKRPVLAVLGPAADASDDDRERFLREARILGQLDHPAVPKVHDVGERDGRLYFTTDRLEGLTIAELVDAPRGDRPPLPDLLRAFLDIAAGVAHAHAVGIVHRGIAPDAIVLGSFGRTWIAGWADADPTSEAAGTLQTTGIVALGELASSDAIVAPEVAMGGGADPRSDVFGLGVILHTILAGEPPDDAVERGLAGRARRRLSARAPSELAAIAVKALAAEPRDRYGRVGDLAEDVRRFLDGRAVSVARGGLLRATVRLARRHPGPFGLAAAAVVIVAGLATFAVARTARSWRERARQAELARERSAAAKVESEEASAHAAVAVAAAERSTLLPSFETELAEAVARGVDGADEDPFDALLRRPKWRDAPPTLRAAVVARVHRVRAELALAGGDPDTAWRDLRIVLGLERVDASGTMLHEKHRRTDAYTRFLYLVAARRRTSDEHAQEAAEDLQDLARGDERDAAADEDSLEGVILATVDLEPIVQDAERLRRLGDGEEARELARETLKKVRRVSRRAGLFGEDNRLRQPAVLGAYLTELSGRLLRCISGAGSARVVGTGHEPSHEQRSVIDAFEGVVTLDPTSYEARMRRVHYFNEIFGLHACFRQEMGALLTPVLEAVRPPVAGRAGIRRASTLLLAIEYLHRAGRAEASAPVVEVLLGLEGVDEEGETDPVEGAYDPRNVALLAWARAWLAARRPLDGTEEDLRRLERLQRLAIPTLAGEQAILLAHHDLVSSRSDEAFARLAPAFQAHSSVARKETGEILEPELRLRHVFRIDLRRMLCDPRADGDAVLAWLGREGRGLGPLAAVAGMWWSGRLGRSFRAPSAGLRVTIGSWEEGLVQLGQAATLLRRDVRDARAHVAALETWAHVNGGSFPNERFAYEAQSLVVDRLRRLERAEAADAFADVAAVDELWVRRFWAHPYLDAHRRPDGSVRSFP